MGSIYNKGDIIFLKNMNLYKRGNVNGLDTRLKGHPFIILDDADEIGQTIRCLKVSSSKKGKRKGEHYLIKNFKLYGCPVKPSYVDIKHVYVIQVTCRHITSGRVTQPVLCTLLKEIES